MLVHLSILSYFLYVSGMEEIKKKFNTKGTNFSQKFFQTKLTPCLGYDLLRQDRVSHHKLIRFSFWYFGNRQFIEQRISISLMTKSSHKSLYIFSDITAVCCMINNFYYIILEYYLHSESFYGEK